MNDKAIEIFEQASAPIMAEYQNRPASREMIAECIGRVGLACVNAGIQSQQREIDRLREELGEAISLLEGADMDLMSWLEARDKFLNKSTTARGE